MGGCSYGHALVRAHSWGLSSLLVLIRGQMRGRGGAVGAAQAPRGRVWLGARCSRTSVGGCGLGLAH